MVANSRSPCSLAVSLHLVISWRHNQPVKYLADDFPINQIFGVQNLHADKVKVGCNEVEIVPMAQYVRIRVIGFQNRIFISTVALIAPRQYLIIPAVCGIELSQQKRHCHCKEYFFHSREKISSGPIRMPLPFTASKNAKYETRTKIGHAIRMIQKMHCYRDCGDQWTTRGIIGNFH